jgi:hypothetical protein
MVLQAASLFVLAAAALQACAYPATNQFQVKVNSAIHADSLIKPSHLVLAAAMLLLTKLVTSRFLLTISLKSLYGMSPKDCMVPRMHVSKHGPKIMMENQNSLVKVRCITSLRRCPREDTLNWQTCILMPFLTTKRTLQREAHLL